MGNTWLANTDPQLAWAHQPWTAFRNLPEPRHAIALLPVHGFADHGLGLPLDVEETIGSAVIRAAASASAPHATLRVLPPLRFGPAPYPSSFFGVDADTARALVIELARGVRTAGFGKLLIVSTDPWHKELLDSAALDARAETGLVVYRIHSAALGLDFHPASPHRATLRQLGAVLLGRLPDSSAPLPADEYDADFRPGHHRQPSAITTSFALADVAADAHAHLADSARRLASLVVEIARHGRDPGELPPAPAELPVIAPAHDYQPWTPYGRRYLPALTRTKFDALPDRERALVILTSGAIEQHGAHLPVGLDAMVGEAVLARALDRLPAAAPVYVAPPLTYGKSTEHETWAGTLSLTTPTFRALVRAQADQLHRHGFRQLAIFNTHGGNSGVLVYTLRELQSSPGLRAGMLGVGHPADLSAQEATFGFHGGEWETSVMLALAPELVDMNRAVRDFPAHVDDPGALRPVRGAASFAWRTEDISTTGIMGDATAATATKGRRWLDEAAAALATRIERLLSA